eukprot:1394701-Amorphochlora_amoeboformis.AAC.1
MVYLVLCLDVARALRQGARIVEYAFQGGCCKPLGQDSVDSGPPRHVYRWIYRFETDRNIRVVSNNNSNGSPEKD